MEADTREAINGIKENNKKTEENVSELYSLANENKLSIDRVSNAHNNCNIQVNKEIQEMKDGIEENKVAIGENAKALNNISIENLHKMKPKDWVMLAGMLLVFISTIAGHIFSYMSSLPKP